MADYNSTNTGAVIDGAVDAVELAKAASLADTTGGRLLKIRDFGLGEISASEYPKTDLDDRTCPVGFYRLTNASPTAGTRPAGFSTFGYIQVYSYDADDKMQVVTDVNGRSAFRIIKTGGNTDWQEYWNSANLVKTVGSVDTTAGSMLKVGDFGLGGGSPPTIPDLNLLNTTGFYRTNPGVNGNPDGGAWEIIHTQFDGNSSKQIAFRAGSQALLMYVRVKGAGIWYDWLESAHSGNNSLIQFGVNANGAFTKFPDGTLICSGNKSSSSSGEATGTFPIAFTSGVRVTATVGTTVNVSCCVRFSNITTSNFDFAIFGNNNDRQGLGLNFIATGRWK